MTARAPRPPTVGFLPWGDVLEDWLDPIGLTLDDFVERLAGGWMFNYVRALERAGVGTVLIVFSKHARAPERRRHAETGAPVWILPPSPAFTALRARQLDEPIGPRPGPGRVVKAAIRNLAPCFATPPLRLARLLRREGCDTILTQEYENLRFDTAALLGRLLGLPVFASFQGGERQVSRLERPIRPLSLRAATGLIIGASPEIDRVQGRYGVPDRKIARIFNPVDLAQFQPMDRGEARRQLGLPEDVPVVVSHGRIRFVDKSTDLLVEAWERAIRPRTASGAHLLLVGDGPDSDRVQEMLEERDVPNVHWIREFVTDRAKLLAALSAADAYVLSSTLEGFPVSPLEAMAMGLPVAATAASGVGDIFEHGEQDGGIVVDRGDVDALAGALGRLLDDAPLRDAMGARARARIEESFALEPVGHALRDFMFGPR